VGGELGSQRAEVNLGQRWHKWLWGWYFIAGFIVIPIGGGTVGFLRGTVGWFWGIICRCWGTIGRLWGTIGRFWGIICRRWGTIGGFWGIIWRCWGTIGGWGCRWGSIGGWGISILGVDQLDRCLDSVGMVVGVVMVVVMATTIGEDETNYREENEQLLRHFAFCAQE
jgi:hypothetical protein